MWQRCPICEGSGRSLQAVLSNNSGASCTTCAGTKIISTLSGLPPKVEKTVDMKKEWEKKKQMWISYNSPAITDFRKITFIEEESK